MRTPPAGFVPSIFSRGKRLDRHFQLSETITPFLLICETALDSSALIRCAIVTITADIGYRIVGDYTDGLKTGNPGIYLHRAQRVKSWLVREGISVRRLTVAGKGFDAPIDDNSTPEGRANNRRIEFRVLK